MLRTKEKSTQKRNKTAVLHLRVTQETKKRIEKEAASQGRSLTNYIEWLVSCQPRKGAGAPD